MNNPTMILNTRCHGLSRVTIEVHLAEATRCWTVACVSIDGDETGTTEGSVTLVGTDGGGSFEGACPIVLGTSGNVSETIFVSITGGACMAVLLDIHPSTEAALEGRCVGFLARQAIIIAQTASGT